MDCSKPSSPKTKLWAGGCALRRFHAALRRFFIARGPFPGMENRMNTQSLTRGAIIAALYAALTLLLAPISYGEVQIRIAEALTLLPVLMPEAVPALVIGCLIANILGGCTVLDIVFGSLATLLAALCTRALRRNLLAASAMPVIFNGLIVGAVVHVAYAPAIPLPLCMLFVAAGEIVSAMLLGRIVLRALIRLPDRMLHS